MYKKYRVTVEGFRESYKAGETTPEAEWVQNTQVESDEPTVIAGTLRALADKLDPPKTSSGSHPY